MPRFLVYMGVFLRVFRKWEMHPLFRRGLTSLENEGNKHMELEIHLALNRKQLSRDKALHSKLEGGGGLFLQLARGSSMSVFLRPFGLKQAMDL